MGSNGIRVIDILNISCLISDFDIVYECKCEIN